MTGGCKTMTAFSALFFFFCTTTWEWRGILKQPNSQSGHLSQQSAALKLPVIGRGWTAGGGRERETKLDTEGFLPHVKRHPHSACVTFSCKPVIMVHWSREDNVRWQLRVLTSHQLHRWFSHLTWSSHTHTGNLHYTHLSKGDFFFHVCK